MARTYAEAVRAGTAAAGFLHRDLDLRGAQEAEPGAIDIFAVIARLDIPLMLRPLKGLLGAFLDAPSPGILVTTERPLSVQRFTAAHELGHCLLKHKPSLDDEDQILRRAPIDLEAPAGFQETEADAFAVAFLMPKWLILAHCARQGWRAPDLVRPEVVYQLSLRLGTSFEALCRTLERYTLIDGDARARLLVRPRRSLKVELLQDFIPENYRRDVWLLTEADADGSVDGNRDDLIILQLREHGPSGYLWNIETLSTLGFDILRDHRTETEADEIGAPALRRVLARTEMGARGRLDLVERRPWAPNTALTRLSLRIDFSGPEASGLSRAERRQRLEAA